MEFVCCSNTRFGDRFISNIIKISSKMKSNTLIDYKNAKLILAEKRCRTLSWIRFSSTKRNTTTVKLKPNCTHTNSRMWLKTHVGYFIHRTIENRFLVQPIFIFLKKAIQLNHEFLADEKVVNSYNNVPFYQSLYYQKRTRTKLLLGQ
jgi:hypothetical protein